MLLNIELSNELALRLVALRKSSETLKETAVRLVFEGYESHKAERAPDETTEASEEG